MVVETCHIKKMN
jgi:hypothetical protein